MLEKYFISLLRKSDLEDFIKTKFVKYYWNAEYTQDTASYPLQSK